VGGKAARACEADHSLPSSVEVKECVDLYFHSPNTPLWRGAQLKRRDDFSFTFTPKRKSGNLFWSSDVGRAKVMKGKYAKHFTFLCYPLWIKRSVLVSKVIINPLTYFDGYCASAPRAILWLWRVIGLISNNSLKQQINFTCLEIWHMYSDGLELILFRYINSIEQSSFWEANSHSTNQ